MLGHGALPPAQVGLAAAAVGLTSWRRAERGVSVIRVNGAHYCVPLRSGAASLCV